MECEICKIRKAEKPIDKSDIELLCGIKTDREIMCCKKCRYTWICDDIKNVLNIID